MEGDKMRLQGLLQPLQENDKFITAINSIKDKRFPINISGLSDSGKSYIIDGIFNEIDNSLVVVTHNEIEAKNLYTLSVSGPRSKISPHTINVWSLFLLLKPALSRALFNSS